MTKKKTGDLKTFLSSVRENSTDSNGKEGVEIYNLAVTDPLLSTYKGIKEYEKEEHQFPIPSSVKTRKKKNCDEKIIRLSFDQSKIKDSDLFAECIDKENSDNVKIIEGKANLLHVDIHPTQIKEGKSIFDGINR